MKILVTADLHLDLWQLAGRDPLAAILPVLGTLDALIVAGDVANDPLRHWPRSLDRIAKLIDPAKVHIVPGNHDYHRWHLGGDTRLTYLGQNHDGDHRLQVHSKGFNDYWEKGNTLRIFIILEDAEGNPLYVHYEAIGVPSRTWDGREMRQRRSEILLNAEVANKIRSVRVMADNDGKSNRLQKAVEKIVADGVAQGATGAIAGSIKALLLP